MACSELVEAELIASRPDSAAHQGARLELAQIEAAQSRLLQMAWLAPRAELALPQELAEDFLMTVLDAAHTEYLFIYVFSDQISDVCQTSDPV